MPVIMAPGMARLARWLARSWDALQVDLNGQYSVERFRRVTRYAQDVTWLRVVSLCALTPVPCLVLVTLMDCIKLEPPDAPPLESPIHWTRGFLVTVFMTVSILEQFRHHMPQFPLPHATIVRVALSSVTLGVASTIALSVRIGHPLPFAMLLGAPVWLLTILGSLSLHWRALLRGKPALKKDLVDYFNFAQVRLSLTLVYPLYNYVFASLESTAQTAFVFVLPLIKLAAKNLMGRALRDHDDLKPEALIFNIEVFHALFVSYSMQNSTSIGTTVALMATDAVHAWLSIRDVNRLLDELREHAHKLQSRDGHSEGLDGGECDQGGADELSVIDLARKILDRDRDVSMHKTIRATTWVHPANGALGVPATPRIRTPSLLPKPQTHQVAPNPSRFGTDERTSKSKPKTREAASPSKLPNHSALSNGGDMVDEPLSLSPSAQGSVKASKAAVHALANMSANRTRSFERLGLVRKTLQLLYVTEFIVLIEFVEIVIPVVYNAYMIAMFHLPNREFYPRLRDMDEAKLLRTVRNVAIYGALELASFVVISAILWARIRVSAVHQLAFVLDQQWVMVQTNLVQWVCYTVQSSLAHIGVDYSFRFAWLAGGGSG